MNEIALKVFSEQMQNKIPIIKALGVEWTEVTSTKVTLRLPLKPNINHVHSVFGGSIYSAMALCCYGLFRAATAEQGFDDNFLVIQNGHIEYLKPIRNDFVVEAKIENMKSWEQFFEAIKKFGRARVSVTATAFADNATAAIFSGVYVYKSINK